jgi:hypothetical protein
MSGLPGEGYASKTGLEVVTIAKQSEAVRALEKLSKSYPEFIEYSLQDKEIFARAYAQYIAEKSGDVILKEELASKTRSKIFQTQWSEKDFKPISEAIDKLFEEQGWSK